MMAKGGIMEESDNIQKAEMHWLFFDQAPVSLAIITKEGLIWDVNKKLLAVLNYVSKEELIGQPYTHLILPSERYLFEELYHKFFAQYENKIEIVINHQTKDKQSRLFLVNTYPLQTTEAHPTHQMIQIFETRLFETDDQMMNDRLYLDAFIEGFSGAIQFKSLEGKYIKVNQTFLDKYGFSSSDEVIGKTDFDLFSKETAQKASLEERQVASTGRPISGILEKRSKNSLLYWYSLTKMPLRNSKGTIIGTYGFSMEITEHKNRELELYEKTQILNSLTEKTDVLIFKCYPNGDTKLLFGNKKIFQALNTSRIAKLSFREALISILDKISSNKNKNRYKQFFSVDRNSKEEVHFETFVLERANSANEEYIALTFDITNKREMEYTLKKNARNLERTNAELNQFAYIVSHDLKAPLRAINNLSEWIEEDLHDIADPDIKENLRLMRNRVGRMENLIQGILSYSRTNKAEQKLEQVNTKALVEDIVEALDIPIAHTVTIDEQLPVVECSRVNLEQVFTNLISNAIKYHDKPNGTIQILYKRKKQHEFTIADDGPGIAPQYHEKIFQMFQTLQARDTLESTGVGLAIVKKIVEGWGGNITIESEEGKGSKFIFTVPQQEENQLEIT